MARAARSDPLVERVDQLADVYGEVLLGLYDELTDQRERTEAVAARADAMLGEARRLMDDMGSAAAQARAIEQEAVRIAPIVQAPAAPAPPGVVALPDPQAEARTREALARLGVLESMAASLEQSVRERTDDAVARCEQLTRGLDAQLRATVQESVNGLRAEVQQTVVDLRQHVRELLDAVTRESHETARRAATAPGAPPAVAPAPQVDTAALADEVRRQASAAIADEVRQQTTTTVADQVGRAAAAISEEVRQQAYAGVAEQIRQQTQVIVGEQLREQAAAAVAEQVRQQTQTTLVEEVRQQTQAAVAQQVQAQAQFAVAQQVRDQTQVVAQQVREQTEAAVAEQVREQAQSAVAEQVRQQAAAAVAIEMREQSSAVLDDLRRQAATFASAPAPAMPSGPMPAGTDQMWAALQSEIERRTGDFAAAEQRANELAQRLNIMITEGRTSLRDAQGDRDAAAFALRESRAELEAAKRALDVSDLSFTLDRLRRAELLLYGTAALAVLAIGLWLWTLLS